MDSEAVSGSDVTIDALSPAALTTLMADNGEPAAAKQ